MNATAGTGSCPAFRHRSVSSRACPDQGSPPPFPARDPPRKLGACPAPSSSSWIPSASAAPKTRRRSATPAPTRSATSPRPAPRAAATARASRRAAPRSQPRPARPRRARRRPRPARRSPTSAFAASRRAVWGYGVEVSNGKDTPSGHWEIAGVPVPFAWGYFPETVPTFPTELTDALIREAQAPRHPRQQACLGHRDHRRARRGAHPDRQADLLHLGRLGLPDRRA